VALPLLYRATAVRTVLSLSPAARPRLVGATAPRLVEPPLEDADDRRVHTRHSVSDLEWLNEARLKYGPPIALIDLSSGGAQIEISSHRPKPGTTVVIEICGADRAVTVPANILRAHVAGLRPQTTYRAALAFRRAIDLQLPSKSDGEIDVVKEYERLMFALRKVYDAAGWTPDRIAGAAQPGDAAAAAVLAATHGERVKQSGGLPRREMGQLLRLFSSGVASGAAPQTLVAQVTECLKRAVPTRSVTLVDGQTPLIHSADAIYFDVPSTTGAPADRLLVEFPRRCQLEPWHLQFLKTAAQLLTVVRGASILRPPSEDPVDASSAWKRVVVRYLDGRLLKGFCDDFSPSTGRIPVWPRPEAPRESRIFVPLAQLKAVFFVHDLEGGAHRGPENQCEPGRRIEVTFADGETLSGTTLSYSRSASGFFVYPVDTTSNNSRTYVMSGAVRNVWFP
jgi:hypothetical protein